MHVQELASLSDRKILRLLRWAGLLVVLASPGVLLLFFEKSKTVSEFSPFVQAAIVLALSVPFWLLGGITYLHPYETLLSFLRHPPATVAWMIAFGTGLWANLSVVACFALSRLARDKLNELVSTDIRMHYIVVYFLVLGVFGFLFMVNSGRFVAKLKKDGLTSP